MKYRLLTQEECAEHRVRYPSAATVLDSGELVCDEIVTQGFQDARVGADQQVLGERRLLHLDALRDAAARGL